VKEMGMNKEDEETNIHKENEKKNVGERDVSRNKRMSVNEEDRCE